MPSYALCGQLGSPSGSGALVSDDTPKSSALAVVPVRYASRWRCIHGREACVLERHHQHPIVRREFPCKKRQCAAAVGPSVCVARHLPKLGPR